MSGKTAYHCDKRSVGIEGKVYHLANFLFILPLTVENGVFVVVCEKGAVGLGVEQNCVDTVYDTRKFVCPCLQNSFKTVGIVGVHNFPGVGGGNGGNGVCALDTAFHIVYATGVFHQTSSIFGKSQKVACNEIVVFSLKLDIVNCENGFCVSQFAVTVEDVKEDGDKAGVPVVTMDNVGDKAQKRQHFKDGSGEESKSFSVVVVAVDTLSFEVVFVVDKVIGYAVIFLFEDTAILSSPTERHVGIAHVFHSVVEVCRDIRIKGQDYTGFNSVRHKGFWKSAGNVAQTTAFNVGERFACGE